MNPLISLHQGGQAVWLDFLARRFLAEGGLKKLVDQDELCGVTSNPSIFEKAIAETSDYDAALKAAEKSGDRNVMSLYESLAIEDIRQAADVLRSVYDSTGRADGYVSLEVSPYLAMDTEATIAEAKRLWTAVGRENLMVKVPATKAGVPAIRHLIGEGINVNVTLLFSQKVYEDVVEAYLAGLEHFVSHGGDPAVVASVASFFVSRIDVAVEKRIEKRLAEAHGGQEQETFAGLRGKIAIANAKLAYQSFLRLFAGPRWENLRAKGARAQRLLWASTGRKNPAYSDVLYVEELIAPETVNTMPPETMDAFRDHGSVRQTLTENVAQAERIMATLGRCGISLDDITAELVEDGVQLFADAFDKLLGALARKRLALLGDTLNSQSWTLSEKLNASVTAELENWRRAGNVRRLWGHDAGLWTGKDEAGWLGWLGIVGEQQDRLSSLRNLSDKVGKMDFSHILLLGMGGSSLGPEVLAKTFGHIAGRAELLVLDSTDPAQIRSFANRIDPARTLFVVSSKSGTTLEPNILKQYFFERAKEAVGAEHVASRFIAVTDPGSQLQSVAARDGFSDIALGKPDIGGRYSVLSDFGIVPGAVMGLDLGRLLSSTQNMVRSCAADVPPAENPGVMLGAILGVLGREGHDKITIVASPGIEDFGPWLEQLLAESTGKQGKGLIPLADEPLGSPDVYGQDRLFVYLRLAKEVDKRQDDDIAALEGAGHPVVRISITDRYQLGQEFFRWEIATAVAGAILKINPFDQPDVEASKVETRKLTTAYEKTGKLPPEEPVLEEHGIKVFADTRNREVLEKQANATLAGWIHAHFDRLGGGDYCALLAYIDRNTAHIKALQEIRRVVRDRKQVATCVGFGPRFLHSTGQAYKGGPNTGVFLQITCDDAADLGVPGESYSFGIVKAAQARGDFEVLAARQRRLLRIHLGSNVDEGLSILAATIRQALA